MSYGSTLALLALTASSFLFPVAQAQTYEDLDNSGAEAEATKTKQPEVVREIVKGQYAKTNVGAGFYLGQFANTVSAGTSVGMAFGGDFIDQKTHSMAWEIAFFQGINNGTHYEDQGAQGCAQRGNCIQGDLRTYSFVGLTEGSWYPTRRIGVGIRAGFGILLSPLLIHEKYYEDAVVQEAWGLQQAPPYHDQIHPVGVGGPTIEYYTKLSHFSVGIDADIFYAVGFDIGASTTGYMKYTF